MIVGGPVKIGQAQLGANIEIWRNNEKVGQGKIKKLQHKKREVDIVEQGKEVGIYFKGSKKIKTGDILKLWKME